MTNRAGADRCQPGTFLNAQTTVYRIQSIRKPDWGVALLTAVSLVAAACTGATEGTTTATSAPATTPAEAAPDGADVTIGLQLAPPTLDLTSNPAAAIPQALLYNVYETLVRLQPDGAITGLLAETWDVSDDGLTYTFRLRPGVTFHNGEAFTADDVVFSINNVLDNPAHPFLDTFAPIESVEKADELTAVVRLKQVSANLLFFLTQGQGVMLKESAVGSIESEPVGTGPFRMSEWAPGENGRITLDRHDGYWGEAPPSGRVVFKYINDPSALTNAMLAGDIDILAGVSAPETLASFAGGDFRVEEGLTHGEIVLSLNGDNPPLDDVRVRRAISHAIDRQAVVDLAYDGYGAPIGSFSTPLDPWHKDLTGAYPFDPEKAKALLEEAGASGAALEMVLPPISYASRSGEIIQSQLADVGLTVNISNVDWGTWIDQVFTNHDYDMSIVSHVEPRDLGSYGDPDYYWGDDSPQVAELISQADAEPDADKRIALYRRVLDEITEAAADAWLFVLPALAVTKTGVSGYKIDLPGSLDATELALDE